MGKKGTKGRQPKGTTKPKKRSSSNRASNARRHAPNDGGAWALAGYAYQFLGSAVLRVSKDYQIIADAGDLTLHVETYSQDAAAVRSDSIELIQFKFSQKAKDIAPQEFADILRALQASTRQIGHTVPKVTWKLITNRNLSSNTVLLRDDPKAKRGRTSAADAAVIEKHGRRCAHDRRLSNDLHAAIEERAEAFGVSDAKMKSAKQAVNGYLLDLVNEPEGNRIVDKLTLEEKIAGFPKPQSMRPDDLKAFVRRDLARIVKELEGKPIEDMVPRAVVRELVDTPGLAIAVVTGHGGCGKTRSVLRGLYDSLNHRNWLAGALVAGHTPKAESFESLANRWRSTDTNLDPESFAKSWERVRIAGRHARPIVVLALDGIDEVGSTDSAKRNVAELIAHFREVAQRVEPPEALLIVTCRVRNTFDNYMRYEGTGGPEPASFQVLQLGDFDEREFVTVWEQWFEGEPLPQVARDHVTAQVMGGTQAPSADVRVRIDALKHPALLGCTRNLAPDERQELFGGIDAVWIKLLASYIRWFASKVSRRRGYAPDRVEGVLKTVARACEDLSPAVDTYELDKHWVNPAMKEPQFGNEMIRDVFREAMSSGLVDSPGSAPYAMPDSGSVPWMWRFRFLQSHLAKLV